MRLSRTRSTCRPSRRAPAGFTLVEMQVAMAVVLIVVSGVIASHLYCLRMFELIKPKLSAADEARAAVARLSEEVRSAFLVRIGSGSASSFTEVGQFAPQAGGALQVYPSSDPNAYIRYFWDENERKVKRTTSGGGPLTVVANSVSNAVIFTSEDFAGNVLTNNQNNRVIGMTLQFYQIQYPAIAIGPGSLYDFYQLKTKITRRTLF